MLSIGKVSGRPGAERYYTDAVARGQEDYYTGSGEAPGKWHGRGAAQLGLSGTVDDDEFASLFRGVAPSGQRLRREPDERSVIGFDLTFSAPKSVSVLYGIGDADLSRSAREAHDDAVAQALDYVERHACFTRRGHAGATQVRGEGLTVGLFRHRTSRAGDPHLHTHAVVANTTFADGRWSTLDGRPLYAHARTAGFLYQAALRDQLSRRLGVEWNPVERGVSDICGIDRDVLDNMSRRRNEILELMAQRGERTRQAARIATLDSRRRKRDVPADTLRANWRAMAAEHGLGQVELAEVLGRSDRERRDTPEVKEETISGSTGVTRETSAFDRRAVLREWAEARTAGASVADIEALADTLLASDLVVQLEPAHNAALGPRYSTPEMLRVERELLDGAERRRGCGAGLSSKPDVEQVLSDRSNLASEQAELVRRLTLSGDGVQVVRAAAGTGKTYALEAARHAWEASGHRVYGCALSARAAIELETQAGIDSTTIARLKLDLERGETFDSHNILVVDEAGMVGSRDLHQLAEAIESAGAKLVLVGDDHQLPEIEAGGAFRGLAERLGAVELHESRRQREEWDRHALAALRVGGVDEWMARYGETGRIVARPSAVATRQQLVDDWWHVSRSGDEDAVMIAHRRSDVADLNARARAFMKLDGRLADVEVAAGERAFAAGDRVLARANDRRTGIVNGARGTVEEVDAAQRSVSVRLVSGNVVQLPSGYLDSGHLDHGYAITAHSAQGATVDRAFVLGSDDLYREWGYTAMTRHREEARFYLVSTGSTERALPGLEPTPDPLLEDLREMLEISREKTLAVDIPKPGFQLPPDRRAEFAALRAAEKREGDRLAAAKEAADEARRRLERDERERASLSRLQRRRAAELGRQIERQRAAVERWEAQAAEVEATRAASQSHRDAWVDHYAATLAEPRSRAREENDPLRVLASHRSCAPEADGIFDADRRAAVAVEDARARLDETPKLDLEARPPEIDL